MYILLQPAINLGLDEERFWEMTVAEIQRYTEGATWRMKTKAQFDYMLANLIGISVARVVSKEAEYPSIEKVYPTLFTAEEVSKEEQEVKEEEERITNSKNRFLEFALKHNAKMKGNNEEVC